jgi:hypothetical protein
MALFQEAIIRKYLRNLDEEVIETAFKEYKRVYSPEKIKNIRVAKEEQYQEGFIKEIFGSVLGYSVYPESPYNIETEKKNETNSKKADGAILKDEKVVGVIELKDNKTKNLDAVKDQAFGYKNNHKECSYVISSNFHKLRFYIDDATDYEEFDLYNLDKEAFKRFYLYLRKEGLLDKNIPKLLRQETKFHEEEISKKLYKDYSNFKRSFYENALKNNPQFDKLSLFKKSQKFLDRVLFILFAEDKGLVTTNSVVQIVEKWQSLKDDAFDIPRPLYNLILLFFNNLYQGKKDNNGTVLIPEFGGELFAPDEVLDQLYIDDYVLKDDLLKLSKYDFNTDVDVNILGHIFEHSLNEVDDVEAELRGEQLDKIKSKRKKDGVFYTPKYITKYIIDNTLGRLCSDKKIELNLDDDIAIYEYLKSDGKLNEKGKNLFERLNSYKNWLLTVTVCDPACGSGAFLNQALSYFMEEHKFIDDLIAELTNTPLRLFDTELQILENNIFGVDINEESVEIAKLSLWLRTAQPGRKLSNLSNNIKCGNSLIDDPEVAGDKAFDWEKEFSTVFEKGGFDVVIGNPPYGAKLDGKNWLKIKFSETSFGTIDSYKYFVQLGIQCIRKQGVLGYIMPDSYLEKEYFKDLRILVSNTFEKIKNLKLGDGVFDDVNLPTAIIILKNKGVKCDEFQFGDLSSIAIQDKKQQIFNESVIRGDRPDFEKTFVVQESIIKTNNTKALIDVYDQVMGVKVYQIGKGFPKQTELELKNNSFISHKQDSIFNYPFVSQGIYRYKYESQNEFISYGEWLAEPRKSIYFDFPKVVIREIINPRIFATLIEEKCVVKNIAAVVIQKNEEFPLKYFLGIINSKLMTYYVNEQSPKSQNKSYPSFNSRLLKSLPIACSTINQRDQFISLVDKLINDENDFNNQVHKLSNYLKVQLDLEKISIKLSKWFELQFSEFINELNKSLKEVKGTPLTKKDEFEWMELFEENKNKALDLKSQIDQTDKEIDRMIYELYGLTEEEIQIVENS